MNRTTSKSDRIASPGKTEEAPSTSTPSPQVDYKGAIKRLGGDHSLFLEFINIFDEDAPELVREIETAFEQNDAENLKRHAHALKGLAMNFGAKDFVNCVADIERAGMENDIAGAASLVTDLPNGYRQLHDELDTHRT